MVNGLLRGSHRTHPILYLHSNDTEHLAAQSSRPRPVSMTTRAEFQDVGTSSLPSERWKSFSALRCPGACNGTRQVHTTYGPEHPFVAGRCRSHAGVMSIYFSFAPIFAFAKYTVHILGIFTSDFWVLYVLFCIVLCIFDISMNLVQKHHNVNKPFGFKSY